MLSYFSTIENYILYFVLFISVIDNNKDIVAMGVLPPPMAFLVFSNGGAQEYDGFGSKNIAH